MLSRVAERIYWLGRYMERSENTARLVNVTSHLLMDLPKGIRLGWGHLIDISGSRSYFEKTTPQPHEKAVVHFLLADKSNPASLINSLSYARENARITREIMPMEAWELLNDLYHYTLEQAEKVTARRDRNSILLHTINQVQQFTGLLAGCMSHNSGYDLIRIGRNLERADMTTRILDVGLVHLTPLSGPNTPDTLESYDTLLWMSVLRSLSAYQMYRQQVRGRVKAHAVVEFLLQNTGFPRAVGHCLAQLHHSINQLPHNTQVLQVITQLQQQLNATDLKQLLLSHDGAHAYIDQLQLAIGELHSAIAKTWFLPSVLAENV